MRIASTFVSRLAASALILVVAVPASRAAYAPSRCQTAIAKYAAKFVADLAKLKQRCREAHLAHGSCPAPDPADVAKLIAKLRTGIDRKCGVGSANPVALGFPGPCLDADPGDDFTVEDLKDCIEDSHTAGVDAVLAVLIDPGLIGPLSSDAEACQHTVVKSGLRYARLLLSTIQKCRNAIRAGKIVGIQPSRCATDDPSTAMAIAKLEQATRNAILGGCSDAEAAGLQLCEPDQPIVSAAADCIIDAIRRLIDDPVVSDPPDLVDFEYAEPRVCGDNRTNQPHEECDGADDAACPGACGAPDGFFACLCQDGAHRRQRVVQHADGDVDSGWIGSGHDQHVPEGSGYVTDLWDCDGPGGPDTICAVGPSCSGGTHSPCSPPPNLFVTGDAICADLGEGSCRKTSGGAIGPHCAIDFQQRCKTDVQCPITGDHCVETLTGPPRPIVSAGLALCLVNVFTEDVVGTTDLATGAGAIRARGRSFIHLVGSLQQPCPVCGGFCAGTPSLRDPGTRTLCSDDSDCSLPPHHCITEPACSFGPNVDQPCRPSAPFGWTADPFGTPSIDCRPDQGSNVAGSGLDAVTDPRTTAAVTLLPSFPCTDPTFDNDACVGGPNQGRPCTGGLDCPAGTCLPQCFCADQERPTPCAAACVGGGNDAAACNLDADCPGGFCHPGDCRPDPSDTDSAQEGHCSVDPSQQCFVNSGIVRVGVPGRPDRVTVAVGCVSGAGSPSPSGQLGFPGPFALTQPETTIEVGF